MVEVCIACQNSVITFENTAATGFMNKASPAFSSLTGTIHQTLRAEHPNEGPYV